MKVTMDGVKNPAQTNIPVNNPRKMLRRIGLLLPTRTTLARMPNAAPIATPVTT